MIVQTLLLISIINHLWFYSIKYEGEGILSFDTLDWVEENGSHTVRSPIVISLDVYELGTGLC